MLESLNKYENLHLNYDNICYRTYLNIKEKTKDANRMVFRNLDYSNPEHKFVIAVAMACWSVLGERDVAVDCNFIDRWAIANKYKKTCKVYSAKKSENIFVDVSEMLEFMRGYACELCGPDFRFGDIYEEYYGE